MGRKRLLLLDIMQGIAMILVVLGHHLFDFMPPIYNKIHFYIYSYHMPLFIFLSGFLISYSYNNKEDYGTYILRRLKKFFIPFMLIGLFVSVLYAFILHEDLILNLVNLLIFPKESPVTFLWYIYVLFFFYALYPLVFLILRNYIFFLLLFVSLVLYFYPIPFSLFCLDNFTKYLCFYLGGCVVAYHFLHIHIPFQIYGAYILGGLFIIFSFLFFQNQIAWSYLVYLPFGAVPALYGFSVFVCRFNWATRILVLISKNCFYIYLWHMFFIQGIAIVYRFFFQKDLTVWEMVIYLLFSSLASILFPIYLNRMYTNIKTILKQI